MEDKYLPIGTVCTVKNKNRKYMIIGYYSIRYSGNVKMYDYAAYPYPEGKLLETEAIAFNHSDILNIDYLGYKSDVFDNFNLSLLKPSINKDKSLKNDLLNNIKFDENGVVIYDGINSYDSQSNNQDFSKNKSIYEFDENGIVTLDNNKNDNPFVHNYSTENIASSNSEQPMLSNLVFDGNGVVISDGDNSISSKGNINKKYLFDEDGMVVADNTISEKNTSDYKNNQDGIAISDSKSIESPYKFNSSGIVTSDGKTVEQRYRFYEKGVVIGEL